MAAHLPELRPAALEDLGAVARFLAAFPREKRGEDHWRQRLRHWWKQNPACTPKSPLGFCCWAGEKLLGFVGNIPTIMLLRGQETSVVNSTAWKVLPQARTYSMSLWYALQKAGEKCLVFATTPSPEAFKVFQALRYRPFPQCSRYTRIRLTYTRPLEVRLKSPALARAAAWLPNRAACLRLGRLTLPPDMEVGWVAEAGAEFDDLWERTRHLYAFTNLRTREIINWHCFANPGLAKILFTCRKGGALAGYLIARRAGSPGDYALECLDLWWDPAMGAVVPALVHRGVQYALAQNWDLVTLPHFSPGLGQELAGLDLGASKEIMTKHSFKAAPALTQELLAGPTYLCGLQGDAGL